MPTIDAAQRSTAASAPSQADFERSRATGSGLGYLVGGLIVLAGGALLYYEIKRSHRPRRRRGRA